MGLFLYRISRWCYLHHIPMVPWMVKCILYVAFHCVIPPECVIGRGTRLWHHGLGIMIHPDVEIGEDCNIYNFAGIGSGYDGPDGPPVHVKIGNRVTIAHGAKILCKGGTLRIGDGATVGVCAVVHKDVPANYVALGFPARNMPKNIERHADAPEFVGAPDLNKVAG